MKKLAIIGASYLQKPLIEKAKMMGIETHVFAWAADDVGEEIADFFYPISIVEKDEILKKCREIGVDGVCSIASDLASITVNYVAANMGLIGNSMECTKRSTNKHEMRYYFEMNNDASPRSLLVEGLKDLESITLNFPVIVKPVDRSGSRGITKVFSKQDLPEAIEAAKKQGFRQEVLVEEFLPGKEYSVECISWKGQHHFLALTEKYTTGNPHYIETGHLEPAQVGEETLKRIKNIVFHALNTLQIMYGASHTEIKVSEDGSIGIIEIGARMGGDLIGSDLVEISTGIDFVHAVIQIALGEKPDLVKRKEHAAAAVRFIFSHEDMEVLQKIKVEHPEYIVRENVKEINEREVTDSSDRFGYFLLRAGTIGELEAYLPQQVGDKE